MMPDVTGVLGDIALWGGLLILLLGLGKLVYVPLTIAFEVRGRLRRERRTLADDLPLVSVIVPAFNEEVVLGNCIGSLLAGDYRNLEVVIVDDGSTDDTARVMRALQRRDKRVRTTSQPNRGKGAALNRGIARARGSVLLFVDADGVFMPTTVTELLRGFDDPRIGAVCGDDRPANVDRVQTQLLALLSHVGTGMVRRALVMLHCLPIVSGNIGAFPRHVIEEIGGFDEETVGEDLELTWRVRKAGYVVSFRPSALVYAESPASLGDLWRQRVRWARGLLQTMRLQAGMIGNPRYGVFGAYLVLNAVTMVILPLVQLALLALLPFLIAAGRPPFDYSVLSVVGWLGLGLSLALVVFATLLDDAGRDLRFLWSLVLWPAYSVAMGAVVATALWQERKRERAPWHKLERTGALSSGASRHLAGLRR